MIRDFFSQQRGNAVLEFALLLPILIGVILVSADLYNINRIRGVFEQSSHNFASILANQSELNVKSFDLLVESVFPVTSLGDYSLIVSKVNLDRSMDWKPIYRGELEGICPEYSEGDRYVGEMPEEDKEESDVSFIVVQLCRTTQGLTMNSGLLGDKLIESVAMNRMSTHTVKLDERLSAEVGVDYD
ncbi:TadE/TadG family type IV pilus assembly protein [Marinomonas transparens]|uniref:Pilus assembly protein n=1 Tax=Marinomonas transparens TaxID=2795388 RepID=A0A934MZX5_9GAMM|nr:pilus assembly protein [Marinomonas transparens]MBJ7536137.1 pilus assembly protein [Marinomonas transparens]